MTERALQVRWSGLGTQLLATVKKMGSSVQGLPWNPASDRSGIPPDVTLSASGRQVHAHQFVLSVCSPFFDTIFRDYPGDHPIIILQDTSFKALCIIISFMYNGEVSVMEKYLPTVIKTAEYLEVKGLCITKLKDQETGKVSVSEDKNFDSTMNTAFQNEIIITEADQVFNNDLNNAYPNIQLQYTVSQIDYPNIEPQFISQNDYQIIEPQYDYQIIEPQNSFQNIEPLTITDFQNVEIQNIDPQNVAPEYESQNIEIESESQNVKSQCESQNMEIQCESQNVETGSEFQSTDQTIESQTVDLQCESQNIDLQCESLNDYQNIETDIESESQNDNENIQAECENLNDYQNDETQSEVQNDYENVDPQVESINEDQIVEYQSELQNDYENIDPQIESINEDQIEYQSEDQKDYDIVDSQCESLNESQIVQPQIEYENVEQNCETLNEYQNFGTQSELQNDYENIDPQNESIEYQNIELESESLKDYENKDLQCEDENVESQNDIELECETVNEYQNVELQSENHNDFENTDQSIELLNEYQNVEPQNDYQNIESQNELQFDSQNLYQNPPQYDPQIYPNEPQFEFPSVYQNQPQPHALIVYPTEPQIVFQSEPQYQNQNDSDSDDTISPNERKSIIEHFKRLSEVDDSEIDNKRSKSSDEINEVLEEPNLENKDSVIITVIDAPHLAEELNAEVVSNIKSFECPSNNNTDELDFEYMEDPQTISEEIMKKKTQNSDKASLPCPFCKRIYLSWGYRRRHIKKYHKKNALPCKWCETRTIFDSYSEWYQHVIQKHKVRSFEAKDSLVVMAEAHAVMNVSTSAEPIATTSEQAIESEKND